MNIMEFKSIIKKYLFACFIFLASCVSTASEISVIELFNSGNNYYSNGEYGKALEDYLKIEEQGYQSAQLFYNIGNACYKSGNIPLSILYLEKSLKLNPSNQDARFNLKLANMKIGDKIEPLPQLPIKTWWNNLVFSASTDAWAWLAIQSFFLAALLFIGFIAAKNSLVKKLAFYPAILALITTALFFTLGYQQKEIITQSKYSIIFEPSVTALSAPDKNGTKLFVVHEGTKVQELETLSEWKKVSLANGNIGWIKAESLKSI